MIANSLIFFCPFCLVCMFILHYSLYISCTSSCKAIIVIVCKNNIQSFMQLPSGTTESTRRCSDLVGFRNKNTLSDLCLNPEPCGLSFLFLPFLTFFYGLNLRQLQSVDKVVSPVSSSVYRTYSVKLPNEPN